MWQKVNPIWMRVGLMKSRPSEWFAKSQLEWADFFVEDIKIRDFVENKYPQTGIAKVIIRKTAKEGELIIFSSKVGVLMWKQGANIKAFEAEFLQVLNSKHKNVIDELTAGKLDDSLTDVLKEVATEVAKNYEGK